MGKTWDGWESPASFQRWCGAWAAECLRVLKPGGHLVAFGGTRTWHRLVCAIEDAGFEIRDTISWLYSSGFPKSLNVSKAIDKAAGAQRQVLAEGPAAKRMIPGADQNRTGSWIKDNGREFVPTVTAPATDDAHRWQGWGTALKPGWEPIVVARKPLAGTVAGNVLAHGTGALNIDGCRVATSESTRRHNTAPRFTGDGYANGQQYAPDPWTSGSDAGRWPTNMVLSHPPLLDEAGRPVGDACADGCVPGCPVAELDEQSGATVSRAGKPRGAGSGNGWRMTATGTEYADAGGASRFFPAFRYEAKADASERPRVNGKAHPTVKPLALMRWLVRLVTPAGGLVLDPFAGSGTTAEACLAEGFRCVAIERESDYLPLIRARLSKPIQGVLPLEMTQ
jgi:site-specific DNA-methyltransferase (adenine-specific)